MRLSLCSRRSRTERASIGLAAALACCTGLPALADPVIGTDLIPNYAGLGIGTTTQYIGANERMAGVAPAFRYQFGDSGRSVEWYGTLGLLNLFQWGGWQLSPAISLRLGRSGVDDPVVARLPEVESTIEGGVVLSYAYTHMGRIPYRLRVGASAMTDLGDTFKGMEYSAFTSLWVPLSYTVFVGMGGGLTWSSASFNQAFFGVTAQGSANSGLPAYTPGSGVRQWYAWPAVLVRVSEQWVVGGGGLYQRLTGEAADSPIVRERGDRNQWTFGVGAGYAWR
jgi:MipA family protein